jgi:pimeloyl-ACP methyl ester carboxylesterase
MSGDGSYRTVLCGGRAIAWSEYGDPAGKPVVYYHAAASSRLECALLHDSAVAAGLRLLAIDLPGSGQTDPIPGRKIGRSVEEDMRMVLSSGDIHRAVFAGRGTGAMYAWAAASEHPDRVAGVVAISPAVPIDSAAVRDSLPLRFRTEVVMARRTPTLLASLRRRRLLADDGVGGRLRDARREGARQGADGGAELALRKARWGFDPAALSPPATVVYGARDPFAAAISAWLAQHPAVAARRVPGGSLLIAEPTGRAAIVEAMHTMFSPAA